MKTITQVVQNLVKPYIDNQDQAVESNIAPVETDATSSTGSYSQGEQLILNKILYDVTAAITVGDPLEVGTNIAVAPKISAAIGGKQEQIEVSSMPTASASNVGKVLIYIGATTSTYTSGQSYQSTLEDGNYIWKPTSISSVDASDVVYDNQTSGLTATDSQAAIDELASQNQTFMKQITVNGAVNELDHTGVTDTSGTVKFTVNEDKSITVSADSYPVTLDSTTTFFFFGTASAAVPNIFKGKKLVGCPSGGASGTFRITIQEFSSTTPSGAIAESSDIGEGANISNGNYIRMYIRIGSGYQLTSALTFKPMISLPELGLSYDDYVPYAKTNRQLTEDSVTWDDLSEVGAVNYLDNTMTSQTLTDADFTVNADKSVTVVVSSTLAAIRYISCKVTLKAGTYKLSGCPSGGDPGGSNGTYRLTCYSNTDSINLAKDGGDGVIFTINKTHNCSIYIEMRTGVTSGTYVFKPMLTDPSYNGPYVPYAKTNRELTDYADYIDSLTGYSVSDFNYKPTKAPFINYVGNASQWANPIADAGPNGGTLLWLGRLDTAMRLSQVFICNNGNIYTRLARADDVSGTWTYGPWHTITATS